MPAADRRAIADLLDAVCLEGTDLAEVANAIGAACDDFAAALDRFFAAWGRKPPVPPTDIATEFAALQRAARGLEAALAGIPSGVLLP